MQAKTVFVTGGTGFLGSFLITFLLQKGYRVVALVRSPDPQRRLLQVLGEVSNGGVEAFDLEGRLRVVEGDIRAPGFGLAEAVQQELAQEVEEIWHCASCFKFQERYREEVIAHNVTGTSNLLDFACLCNQGKAAPAFYVSTAYAAPVSGRVAREELPSVDATHRNLYEWSKQEAERLVERFRRERHLPAVILRPTIVVGHSVTGKAIRFTGCYDVFRALYLLTRVLEVNLGPQFDRNLRLRIPAQPDLPHNFVPVDFLVEAMWQVSRAERRDTFIFNLANDTAIPSADLFRITAKALRVTGIELMKEDALQQRSLTGLERLFTRQVQFQAPYLLDSPFSFDTTNFRRLVPDTLLSFPRVDEEMLSRTSSYYLGILAQQFSRRCPTPPPLSQAA
ncbi:MAG: NAD-dependent epimerase/dehydratase family protein [Deltaproteobacteria bacterium]|nr:MAG: NAD-dependent epimerase/dehydratase family protein [Deltaproteobacteria bacterium]